jgi:hypothetical protein
MSFVDAPIGDRAGCRLSRPVRRKQLRARGGNAGRRTALLASTLRNEARSMPCTEKEKRELGLVVQAQTVCFLFRNGKDGEGD